jgi:hypothetical protein
MVPGSTYTEGYGARSNEATANAYLANNEMPIKNSINGISARNPGSLISNVSLTFNFSSSGPNGFSNDVLNAFSGASFPVNSVFGFTGGGSRFWVGYNRTTLVPQVKLGTPGSPAILSVPATYNRRVVWQKR